MGIVGNGFAFAFDVTNYMALVLLPFLSWIAPSQPFPMTRDISNTQ